MDKWKEWKLADFMDFNPKRIIKKGVVARKVAMENLEPLRREISSYTHEAYKGGTKFINGDTIMARITPCLENGKQAYVSFLNEGEVGFGSTEYIIFRGKEGISNNMFVYYLSLYNVLKDVAVKSMVGSSGRQRVQTKVLEDYILNLPPLSVQEKIASILSSLDDKIECNRKINKNLEQQAQALFKSWFVNFEPFKDGNFVESELGMIPEGWSIGNIYHFIKVIYGAPYKSTLFNDKKEGNPLIRIRDLKTFSPQFYTPEILPNTEFIQTGDVIAGMDAEFTPYLWLGKKGVLNQRCCKFVGTDENIGNYYILYLLKPELEYVQSYKTGTTVSHLGKSDIDKFKVIVPPLEVVEKFTKITKPLLEMKKTLSNEIQNLSQHRDTLLPKLMSGELQIKD